MSEVNVSANYANNPAKSSLLHQKRHSLTHAVLIMLSNLKVAIHYTGYKNEKEKMNACEKSNEKIDSMQSKALTEDKKDNSALENSPKRTH